MICPSILSYDFTLLKDIFVKLENAGIEVVHFDVMDNHFVPNLTFGYKFIDDLRKYTSKIIFDTHLMIDKPEDNIILYSNSSDIVTVHFEAIKDRKKLIKEVEKLKNKGKKFGISIKPKTKPKKIKEYIDIVDLVLIMSVEPGFGGQELIPYCLDKVEEVKLLRGNRNIIIQMDGGINKNNFYDVYKRGVEWFVIGSAFFKEDDFSFYNRLLKDIKNGKYI